MNSFNVICMSVVGLLIGSFLNVCIYRIPRNESINWPPSHCPNCKVRLKPVDLVPVLSYLFLRGQCRNCKNGISWVYPVVEATNAILYVAIYKTYGLTIQAAIYMAVASILLVIAKIDQETETIPDGLNLTIGVMGIVALCANGVQSNWQNQLLGFLLGGGFFLAIAILTQGAMGGGDIKMMAAIGALLGWKGITQVTLLSFVFGAILSALLIIMKIKGRKDTIPFGPFIALATVVYLLFGDKILHLYLHFITGT